MCTQQQKDINYEMIDGKSGSLQVSNTSTEDQYKLLLKKHLQETHGFQEDGIQVEYYWRVQNFTLVGYPSHHKPLIQIHR